MADLRGPVIQPVRKLSSCQPHTSNAEVKAQYAPDTVVCCAVCASATSASKPEQVDSSRLSPWRRATCG
jgi:hypothetical protein